MMNALKFIFGAAIMMSLSHSCESTIACTYKTNEFVKDGLDDVYYGRSNCKNLFDKKIEVENEDECCATTSNWYTYPSHSHLQDPPNSCDYGSL